MTALEKVLELHSNIDAEKIVRYGCPHEKGFGIEPEWCKEAESVTHEQCLECWNQEYKGE